MFPHPYHQYSLTDTPTFPHGYNNVIFSISNLMCERNCAKSVCGLFLYKLESIRVLYKNNRKSKLILSWHSMNAKLHIFEHVPTPVRLPYICIPICRPICHIRRLDGTVSYSTYSIGLQIYFSTVDWQLYCTNSDCICLQPYYGNVKIPGNVAEKHCCPILLYILSSFFHHNNILHGKFIVMYSVLFNMKRHHSWLTQMHR